MNPVAAYRVDAIDPALRRSGRFDAEIEVTVPNEDDRFQILKVNFSDVKYLWSLLRWFGYSDDTKPGYFGVPVLFSFYNVENHNLNREKIDSRW